MARRGGNTFDIEDEEEEVSSTDGLTGAKGAAPKKGDVVVSGARTGGGVLDRLQRQPLLIVVMVGIVVALVVFFAGADRIADPSQLKLATWNIAAINNNPFEYWITHDDAEYKKLMSDVQDVIDTPGDADVPLKEVLTADMLDELKGLMASEGWGAVDAAVTHWQQEYADRKIVSGFIKDGKIGKKRLVSMPDRITNTINLRGGGLAHRPAVINCYSKRFGSEKEWWSQWKAFMFKQQITLSSDKRVRPCELLGTIPRAKYPDLSESEETMSKPLSTIAQAAFDAILVHLLATTAGGAHKDKWQPLRSQMCTALNSKKNARTAEILGGALYRDADVIFLQEVAGAFIKTIQSSSLGTLFDVRVASTADGKRDQNSAMLLRRSRFDVTSVLDHTEEFNTIIGQAGKNVPIAAGDVLVLSARDTSRKSNGVDGVPYLLASFHGDTNGLATIPVVSALSKLAQQEKFAGYELLFGLDANTYAKGSSSKQDVLKFADAYGGLGLTSCWGDRPDPKNHTTFNARTYLQPQLNKAVKLSDMDRDDVGDKNPKDFILFTKGKHEVVGTRKDNTGKGEYIEGMVFPTLQFPSDHGLLTTILRALPDAGHPEP